MPTALHRSTGHAGSQSTTASSQPSSVFRTRSSGTRWNTSLPRKLCVVLAAAIAWPAICTRSDEAKPYPRISEEAFKARLAFFDYDKSVPLEGRVVRQWDNQNSLRQKSVFRGAQGFLVPGQLEFPRSAAKPFPLVLLLHGWSGSKEDW